MESLESQLSNGMHNSDLPNYQIMVFWSAPVLYITQTKQIHVLLLQVSVKSLNHHCITNICENNPTNIVCDFIFNFLVTVNKRPIN